VFAPPVTRERAAALAEASAGRDCVDDGDAAAFGRPTSHCAVNLKGGFRVTYQGLFGDAWLSCRLSLAGETQAVVRDRASQWCAAVAAGASGG
jgi:hypothetical protein